MIDQDILNSVGKKMRNSYLLGQTSEKEILVCHKHNVKELASLNTSGWTVFELMEAEKRSHNPLVRSRLRELIDQHKQKSRCSIDQNKLSMLKLDYYLADALDLGLRKVMKHLNKIATTGNVEAKITLLLMQMEFANLVAKKRHDKKEYCYERKDILLMQVSDLLRDAGWKCGISYNAGKNASYLIFVYLPDGTQLSWHCNNYHIVYYYDEVCCEWDGMVCSTLEKLLAFAHSKFGIGSDLVKYEIAA